MAWFIHVVGKPGSGKSTLILGLADHYSRPGKRCAGQDPDVFRSRRQAVEQCPDADIYFIEHDREEYLDAMPGDRVIRVSDLPAADHGA